MRKEFSILLLPNIVLFGTASIFFVIGLIHALDNRRMLMTYERANGTVMGNSEQQAEDGSTAYYPTISFQPEDRRPITFTDPVGSYPADYEAGDSVAVLYNPADPSEARIHSWKRLWLVPTILTAVGLIPILIGLAVNISIYRSKPTNPPKPTPSRN